MTDHFLLLRQPRQPWLELDPLKELFLRLSAEVHPDHCHAASEAIKDSANERFAELNAAYGCLRDLKSRLLHLLELELGASPKDIQRIPPGTMDLAMEIGQTCREVDDFMVARAKVSSPMLKVQVFQRGMEWTDKVTALQQKVNAKLDELMAELQTMNRVWESAPALGTPGRAAALSLDRLELIYRALSYIGRWTQQLQERLVQLAI